MGDRRLRRLAQAQNPVRSDHSSFCRAGLLWKSESSFRMVRLQSDLPQVAKLVAPSLIFVVPVLVDGVGRLCQPSQIFAQFHDLGRGEEFQRGRGRITERLQKARGDENRDVVCLEIQNPSGLFWIQTRWHVRQERQKLALVFFHFVLRRRTVARRS